MKKQLRKIPKMNKNLMKMKTKMNRPKIMLTQITKNLKIMKMTMKQMKMKRNSMQQLTKVILMVDTAKTMMTYKCREKRTLSIATQI